MSVSGGAWALREHRERVVFQLREFVAAVTADMRRIPGPGVAARRVGGVTVVPIAVHDALCGWRTGTPSEVPQVLPGMAVCVGCGLGYMQAERGESDGGAVMNQGNQADEPRRNDGRTDDGTEERSEERFTAAEELAVAIIDASIHGQLAMMQEGWESGTCQVPDARTEAQRRLIGASAAGPAWSRLLQRIEADPGLLLPALMTFELIAESALTSMAEAREVEITRVIVELRLGMVERQMAAAVRNAARRRD